MKLNFILEEARVEAPFQKWISESKDWEIRKAGI
jgi:hypothetical protein